MIERLNKQTTMDENRNRKELQVRIRKMKWDIMKMPRVQPHIEFKKWNLAEKGRKLRAITRKGKVDSKEAKAEPFLPKFFQNVEVSKNVST